MNSLVKSNRRALEREGWLSRRTFLNISAAGLCGVVAGGSGIPLYAQTNVDPQQWVNVLLDIEYLETALLTSALGHDYPQEFRFDERAVLERILEHDMAHVGVLLTMSEGRQDSSLDISEYDFTGDGGTGYGPFRGAFGAPAGVAPSGLSVSETTSSKTEFFKVVQLIKELSVRAYKGSLEAMMDTSYLPRILGLHSSEARHAAQVRLLRNSYNAGGDIYTNPRYMDNRYPMPNAVSALASASTFGFSTSRVYPQSLTQVEFITGTEDMPGVYGYPRASASSSNRSSSGEDNLIHRSSQNLDGVSASEDSMFDEPLDINTVRSILSFFFSV